MTPEELAEHVSAREVIREALRRCRTPSGEHLGLIERVRRERERAQRFRTEAEALREQKA